ncbi:lysophospholipid acyltransferase family protein [Gulosibacter molinativorax]|uniref:1-acyl-sn-glycerol-3-phosphate acyltransferase n=1 Tax=Gulosibacter molinativorax TaxID=256821 RepID=A0ABT7C5Q8_9MICO|nr:lysophospholipid acyltransferase family protein [Gulosibacter molinativorax]MDJ1370538.1 1-acyl-sn-glycerol-3-phosphate acyltransferase [Gulosibacter molinativorax]QUY62049.1 1-acyl-sn-glycerol-3-phosphate acyltransferase protein [Gulosibacter molinativorax]
MTRIIRELLAGLVRLITGARPVVDEGLSPRASVLDLPPQMVLYANHSSHLDFVTVWAVVPRRIRDRLRPVAAGDYWGSGLKRWLATNIFNAYLVDRGGGRGGSNSNGNSNSPGTDQIADMLAILDDGDSLLIFPEGTRGDGTDVARFRSGLYRLAQARPDVPVIPVALSNLGRMLPKGAVVPVPHLVTATFLTPVRLEPGEDRAEFLERARLCLAEVVREAQT